MDKEFTVTEHLDELRKRIIFALVSVIATTLITIPFSSDLLQFLKIPAAGRIERLVYFGPEEAFLIYMRISLTAGIVLAFPVIIYQVWAFLSPAIGMRFKRYASLFVTLVSFVFFLGCVFAYTILLPAALRFLLTMGAGQLEPVISATRYIAFVTGFVLACGLVFEMPVASFFLTRMGLISAALLRKKFLYAVVVILIAAAVITPTGDAFNMLMLAVPMLLLYEVSIWVSAIAGKREAL